MYLEKILYENLLSLTKGLNKWYPEEKPFRKFVCASPILQKQITTKPKLALSSLDLSNGKGHSVSGAKFYWCAFTEDWVGSWDIILPLQGQRHHLEWPLGWSQKREENVGYLNGSGKLNYEETRMELSFLPSPRLYQRTKPKHKI